MATSKTWTQNLDPDPEKSRPRKTWKTRKTVGCRKKDQKTTWYNLLALKIC